MKMAKILSDNDNYPTNTQMKSWSLRKIRWQLRNINNSLHSNNARLFVLQVNRCPRTKGIFHFFFEGNNNSTKMSQGLKEDYFAYRI